jgi:hypothetical protein
MNNTVLGILIFGVLLLMLVAPFAALAPLMGILLLLALSWFGWTMIKAFVTGKPES